MVQGGTARPVMIKETGQRWDSVGLMAAELGLDPSHLYKKLRGARGNGHALQLTVIWEDEKEES